MTLLTNRLDVVYAIDEFRFRCEIECFVPDNILRYGCTSLGGKDTCHCAIVDAYYANSHYEEKEQN
jgi:hypothetical protein